jgi:hypothetical protein
MTPANVIRACGLASIVAGVTFAAVNGAEVLQPSMGAQGGVLHEGPFRVYQLAMALVVMPGFFAGHLGYYAVGAAGGGPTARSILSVAAAGCGTFVSSALYAAASLDDTPFRLAGYPINEIGMALVMFLAPLLWGIVGLQEGDLPAWKRLWPLVVGLTPAVLFGLAVPRGLPPLGPPVAIGLAWLVFGVAVFTEARADRPR